MHERSLASSIVRAVERAARAEDARRVLAVRARVPELSAVSLDHLRLHFRLASAGTIAEGAQVDLVAAPDGVDVVIESIEIEDEGRD